jgi:DNA repair photolyase
MRFDFLKPNRRASLSNPRGRFNSTSSESHDDGWNISGESFSIKTVLQIEKVNKIITKNDSPDIPHKLSINPYKGCEHGCIYCYARPTHAYNDLSSGLDFETKIFYKPNASQILETEFSKKNYLPSIITIGANTDPYQPSEKKLLITRNLLKTFLKFKHPVALITKSFLVTRDIDLLSELSKLNLVNVFISITSLKKDLTNLLEPRAAIPSKRLEAVELLSKSQIQVGVMTAPIIPFLNDSEIESILEEVSSRGAITSNYVLLRLPFEVKDLFVQWIEKHFPLKAKHVLNLIRSTRNGKLYESEFGTRMVGTGNYAKLIQQRYFLAKKRFNLNQKIPPLNLNLFEKLKPESSQLSLF